MIISSKLSPPSPQQGGITLLLVILVISAILAISIGIFNLVFTEIRISGEMADSFIAFYAGDQGVENLLYDDRVANSIPGCGGPGACTWSPAEEPHPYVAGACIKKFYDRNGAGDVQAIGQGKYRCGVNPLTVMRAANFSYNKP